MKILNRLKTDAKTLIDDLRETNNSLINMLSEYQDIIFNQRDTISELNKIIVNKEELEELLRELRMKTPDEIKRYQKIINNKEAILNDAREKADQMIR